MENIRLSFYGEEVTIPTPKDLRALRKIISEEFVFSPSDAEEIILSYSTQKSEQSQNNTYFIYNEEEYKSFLKLKIALITLDISQNSTLYQESLNNLMTQEKNNKQLLFELLQKNYELNKEKETKFAKEKKQIENINKQIKKLKRERKKIHKYIKKESKKINEEKKQNEQKISELKNTIKTSLNFTYTNTLQHELEKITQIKNQILTTTNQLTEKLQQLQNASFPKSFSNNQNKEKNQNKQKIILKAAPKKNNITTNSLFDGTQFNPKCFNNREISWLKFNVRILNEAKDKTIPLLERTKFLAITASNLDEWFMVRYASLMSQVEEGDLLPDIAGLTPAEQLQEINITLHDFAVHQYATYNRSLHSDLLNNGIQLIDEYDDMNEQQKKYVEQYFEQTIFPVLSPYVVDSSMPFPLVNNKTINIGVLLKPLDKYEKLLYKTKNQSVLFGNVQVPTNLPRLVNLPPCNGCKTSFILLEKVVEYNVSKIFKNYENVCSIIYRVTRNADVSIDEDHTDNLLKEMEKQLKNRKWGNVIRLEIEDNVDENLLKLLQINLEVEDRNIFKLQGPIDLTIFFNISSLKDFDNLRVQPYTPQLNPRLKPGTNIFEEIRKGDIFLHHPYETFDPVVTFVQQASVDPDVTTVNQTLYRVSGNSPIVHALIQAGKNGKKVTILLELKARFDEENNIKWAKELEKVGCKVVYGVKNLKTHCKLTLVERNENNKLKRYVHLGTGNYNDSTAKIYTDCGILSCRDSIGEDAAIVFKMLRGLIEPKRWNKLIVAPIWMKKKFLTLIDREIQNVQKGQKGMVVAKMNALVDKTMIEGIYKASMAGVKVHLIVRGICCLKTGIPGISENITVESLVGTFLEHCRIYYFYNGGKEELYMGSADWMPRNLDKRVEIIFPLEDSEMKKKAKHIIDVQMADNKKAYFMLDDGSYRKRNIRGNKLISAQEQFCEEAINAAKNM